MLLNISNHPSENWSEAQLFFAKTQFGAVEDLPFPNIDPFLDSHEIDKMATFYFNQIKDRADSPELTVHLMGEMTFSFKLISKLKKAGFPVVASTSERVVLEEENGKKTVAFTFAQFRNF